MPCGKPHGVLLPVRVERAYDDANGDPANAARAHQSGGAGPPPEAAARLVGDAAAVISCRAGQPSPASPRFSQRGDVPHLRTLGLYVGLGTRVPGSCSVLGVSV